MRKTVAGVRTNMRWTLGFILSWTVLWVILIPWITSNDSFESIALRNGAFLLMMGCLTLASVLLGAGLGRRIGDEFYCKKCGYQVVPSGPPSTRCPECGLSWAQAANLVRGRRVLRPKLLAAGMALFLLFVISVPVNTVGLFHRMAPTSMLIRTVSRPGVFAWQEWSELNRRSLTQEEIDDLARRLLDVRLKAGRLDHEAENWLDATVNGGLLPPSMVNRYYDEMFAVSLSVECVDNGARRVRIRPQAIARTRSFLPTSNPYILIEGFYVNGGPKPLLSSSKAVHIENFCTAPSEWNGHGRDLYCPKLVHELGDENGPTTIRFACWLAIAPVWIVHPIRWTDDGKPISVGKITYQKRFVVETTIRPEDCNNQ